MSALSSSFMLLRVTIIDIVLMLLIADVHVSIIWKNLAANLWIRSKWIWCLWFQSFVSEKDYNLFCVMLTHNATKSEAGGRDQYTQYTLGESPAHRTAMMEQCLKK